MGNQKKVHLLELGSFVTATITELPTFRRPGSVKYVKDGGPRTALFAFAEGYKVIPGQKVPELASGIRGRVYVSEEIVAFVSPSPEGFVVTAWGTAHEYRDAIKKIIARQPDRVQTGGVGNPAVPDGVPADLKKSHHGSNSPLPRRYIKVTDVALHA